MKVVHVWWFEKWHFPCLFFSLPHGFIDAEPCCGGGGGGSIVLRFMAF